MLQNELGVASDIEKAQYWFEKAAKQGNNFSQFHLANLLLRSNDKRGPDYKKAFYWMERSAKQGYGQAQRKLGELYQFGIGCSKNTIEARIWYKKASEQGDEVASYLLKKLENKSKKS